MTARSSQQSRRDLYAAAAAGKLAIIEEAIAQGRHIDGVVTEHGESLLVVAARHDQHAIIARLLQAGIKPEGCNADALRSAAANGRVDCVQMLIAAGADVNYTNKYGDTALHYVCRHSWARISESHVTCLHLLLQAGATIKSASRLTPILLITAAANDHPDIIEVLLQHGARLDVVDADGQTACDVAMHNGNFACAYDLLKKGAPHSMKHWFIDLVHALGREDDKQAVKILECSPKTLGRLAKTENVYTLLAEDLRARILACDAEHLDRYRGVLEDQFPDEFAAREMRETVSAQAPAQKRQRRGEAL